MVCSSTPTQRKLHFVWKESTRKATRFLLQKFPKFLKLIFGTCKLSTAARARLFAHAYIFQKIREILSSTSRTEATGNFVHLDTICQDFYVALSLFFYIYPTAWVLGMDVPRQARWMEGNIGLGLGAGLAQASENKHNDFRSYLHHTNNHNVWPTMMRHDAVNTRFLLKWQSPERIIQRFSKKRRPAISILPAPSEICACGMPRNDEACIFCSDSLWEEILVSVETKEMTGNLKKLFASSQISYDVDSDLWLITAMLHV